MSESPGIALSKVLEDSYAPKVRRREGFGDLTSPIHEHWQHKWKADTYYVSSMSILVNSTLLTRR